MRRLAGICGLALPFVLLAGCAWTPREPPAPVHRDGGWASWGTPGAAPGERSGTFGDTLPGSPTGDRVVALARGLLGTPYRWGGQAPGGFDCSGLVYYAYGENGVSLPRTSRDQFRAVQRIPLDAARPGDLVFFGRGGRISHVGIYLGENRFIHSPESGQPVKVSSIEGYYRERFAGAGRVPGILPR